MSEPKGYVDPGYLQAAAERLRQIKEASYTRMQIEPGYKVLDVGCGPGTDTITLARLVGPTGKVVGVDYDEAMIAKADQRAEEEGVSAWVTHRRGDVTSLPFEPGDFDSCRSDRLFQHLSDPEQALSEMTRVTKSGGWIVVMDTDWGTLSIDTTEVDIERRLLRFNAESYLHNGYSGRQLYRLFRHQKLTDISVDMFPNYTFSYAVARQSGILDQVEREALEAGIVTGHELHRWRACLEEADAKGVFFASFSIMMLTGRKT